MIDLTKIRESQREQVQTLLAELRLLGFSSNALTAAFARLKESSLGAECVVDSFRRRIDRLTSPTEETDETMEKWVSDWNNYADEWVKDK